MDLTPDDIRHRRFPVRRRGYETASVDAFLEDLADALDREADADAFDGAGREIAHVLRATHEEAARLRAATSAEAEAILSQAEVEAEALQAGAEDERTKAKELLVRSRQRATEVETEAEERAAAIVGSAEQQARDRVTDILRSGRERLEQLVMDEEHARRRLMEAHADLQEVIHRVSEHGAVIDLTAPGAGLGTADGGATERPAPLDPLEAMVRDAVERAVAHSTRAPDTSAGGAEPEGEADGNAS